MTIKNRFPSGASTETEVALLMQLNLEPGEIVPYERIAKTSGVPYGPSRFRTVVEAWARRVFREQNLQHRPVRGIGVRFLTDEQALAKGIDDARKTARADGRTAKRVRKINTQKLTAYQRKSQELLGQHLRARDHAARMFTKELVSPKAVTSTVIKLAIPDEVSASDAPTEKLAAGRLSALGDPSLAG